MKKGTNFPVGSKNDKNTYNIEKLDGKTIEFNTAFADNQKLLNYPGELYPEQNKSFKVLEV